MIQDLNLGEGNFQLTFYEVCFQSHGGVEFYFFIMILQSSETPQGWLKSYHFIIGCAQRNEDTAKLHRLFPRVHREDLAIQLFWVLQNY